MNSIIKKIEITAFRSIEWASIKCGAANVFSGMNDAGKSNVLKALNLFFNSQTDFLTNLKFSDDYNKVALTKAVKASKMKQQIKIRLYLNPPESYRSLLTKHEQIWIERSYDRYGVMTEKFSDDAKKRIIVRLLNKLAYIYISALKGKEILQYILGLIGEYQLIDSDDISLLNDKIKEKTKDLTEILQGSKIGIDTSFGLPTLLSDFWEKLSVDTVFDKAAYVNEFIEGTGKRKSLSKNQFSIPLTLRGDGIKSKYIPPLLQWLQQNNESTIYVWGIDEPENSLEFALCEELARLYYNKYSAQTQCFLTTHSLAFMNPPDDVTVSPNLFRCTKDDLGSTEIVPFDDLFKESDKLDLFNELGVLEVQKELMIKFREFKDRETEHKVAINALESELSAAKKWKCIVLTEDEETAFIESILRASKFVLAETHIVPYRGCTNIPAAKALAQIVRSHTPNVRVIVHLDRDYLTDDEVEKKKNLFEKENLYLFVTDGTDIESHFVNANHINKHHPTISVTQAEQMISMTLNELEKEAIQAFRVSTFGASHKDKKTHLDQQLIEKIKNDPLRFSKGKLILQSLKGKIQKLTKENPKLHKTSRFVKDSALVAIAKSVWKH